MIASSSNFYQIGASLPVDAVSYVQRQADEEFYQKLRSGKFCYVLNSRQMGKSSLRVRTMQRLQKDGTVCAAIDLTGIGKHKVTIAQWYGGIVYGLVESCQLEDKFDFDWQIWWQKKQSTLDPVMCLRLFIEQVLLSKIQQPIVIFVDEIDRVLSQDFSLDDFFALIRFFQNQRVDNPVFERLTFALLGVATPSDLITDKTQTPFNIGVGIELHGFRLGEVQPLINGLEGKVSNPQQVMEEILDWTGGQPFLTQKLCKFMVEESNKDNPRSVGEVVRARIIANWESQDDPEHLRTIRDRILSNEQRASYLLELYQLLRLQGEIASNNSIEVSELQLSGLVVKTQEKLRVYNRIYEQIFDDSWIEAQLKNLRPYSENFRFWVASGGTDESRLLRGKALQEAEEWAKDKNLSYQDRQFLAASKGKEIQEEIIAKEKEAALERERKDREATEERNQVLSEANKTLTKANQKAKQRIRIGSGVLVMTLVGAVISIIWAGKDIQEIRDDTVIVQQLSSLSQKLDKEDKSSGASMAREKIGLSYEIKDHDLKKAMLFASISQAYQQLGEWDKANEIIQKSLKILVSLPNGNSEVLQLQVLTQKLQGDLQVHTKKMEEARKFYEKAFMILKNNRTLTSPFIKSHPLQLITAQDIENIHRQLIDLPSNNKTKTEFKKEDIKKSLTEHLYAQLEDYLNAKKWEEADFQTYRLMLNIAKTEKQRYLNYDSINSFSCPDLQRIDKLWVDNSNKRFGFSVQKEIWIQTGNRLGIRPEQWNDTYSHYKRFALAVGWYDSKGRDNETGDSRGTFVSYDDLIRGIKSDPTKYRGSLPSFQVHMSRFLASFLALRFVNCNL